jgi:hypothetical protein
MKCGGIDVYYPWATLVVLVGAIVMIGVGLFQKQGSPNGWLIIPGVFLFFALLGFQIWADSNMENQDAYDQRAGGRRIAPGTEPAVTYAVRYVDSESGTCRPMVRVVRGVEVAVNAGQQKV